MAQFVATWDGHSWTPLGDGLNNIVRSLALRGSELFVGGDFTQAGGKPSFHIARWNIGAPVGQTGLNIRRYVDHFVIEWLDQPPLATLETSATLNVGGTWLPVDYVRSGGTNRYTNLVEPGASYFRLR